MSSIATIGHNNPPEPTPFELSKAEIDDLFLEASNFVDGEPILTKEIADAVETLMDGIQAAIKTAEARRKAEVKPFDDAKAEIQDRYNTLIGDNKSVTGRAILAKQACVKALTPYREKVEAEKKAAAEAARKEAEAKQQAAIEAMRKAQADDLAAKAAAQALAEDAAKAAKAATKTEKAAATGNGLRTTYHAKVTDYREFARWVWTNKQADMEPFLDELAERLVRNNQRGMPGVEVIQEKKAV